MFTALAVVVAVVCGREVVTVELPVGQELGRWEVPGEPAGIFVAPDGALWLPLRALDETVVIPLGSQARRVPGRLAPLFFREPDRIYAVFPGELAALSYPERVRLASWPLPAELELRFAACSEDGRVVALLDASPPAKVLLLFPFDSGQSAAVPLAGFPEARKLAVGSRFLAVGGGSRVEFWPIGAAEGIGVRLPGEVVDIAWAPDGRQLFVLLATPRSELWRVPVPKKLSQLPKPKALWWGPGAPRDLAASEAGLVVLAGDGLFLVSFRGHGLAQFPCPDGRALGLVPSRPATSSVPWSDSQP